MLAILNTSFLGEMRSSVQAEARRRYERQSMNDQSPILEPYELEDRYTRTEGRVFLTGTQAIVRIALDQARRDRAKGLDTRGFISGYRGSPVGGIDMEVARNRDIVQASGVECLPAVNEEFGATQMLGTQQVETDPDKTCEGVFGLWYGKGPGVDRASDALKHGNAYGASPTGGVLVVAGDDHGCVSSSMPHQSDVAFMNFFMPALNPANVAEFLPFAEWGYALSRFSGMWVGFKAVSETVESGMSFELQPEPRHLPNAGLHAARDGPALPLARPARSADRGADGGQEGRRPRLCAGQPHRPGRMGARGRAVRDRHDRQVAPRRARGASPAGDRRGPARKRDRPRHLQGRDGLAARGAGRACRSRTASRSCWSSRRSAASSRAS